MNWPELPKTSRSISDANVVIEGITLPLFKQDRFGNLYHLAVTTRDIKSTPTGTRFYASCGIKENDGTFSRPSASEAYVNAIDLDYTSVWNDEFRFYEP